jgi:general transcription factor 3C polypeptide 3 (transcription factor C subunit 4)
MDGPGNSYGRVGRHCPDSSNQEVQPPIDPAIDPRLFDSSYLTLEPGSDDVGFEDYGGQVDPFNTASMSIGQRRLLQEQVDLSGSNDESDDVDDYDDDDDQLWNEGKEV